MYMKHVLLTVVFLGIACVAMAHELLSPNGNLKLISRNYSD